MFPLLYRAATLATNDIPQPAYGLLSKFTFPSFFQPFARESEGGHSVEQAVLVWFRGRVREG